MPDFCIMKNMRIALFVVIFCAALNAGAQENRSALPYQKSPMLPAMMLLLQDSSTTINLYNVAEGRPTVLFFFSPDCDHCHMTTEALLEKMDSMKGADFYFFTAMPLSFLQPFAAKYHLDKYKNITVGKDYQYFFPPFYGAKTVPYLVLYDRHKKFVKLYDGGIRVPELISLLESL